MQPRVTLALLTASVFSLGACQIAGSGGGGGAGSTSSQSAATAGSGAGGGAGSTSSASTGEAACADTSYPKVHVDSYFAATVVSPGCEAPKHMRAIDGVVHYEGGVLHVQPFVADAALCIANDYTVSLDVPAGVMAADPPIPAGAFVHLVSTGDDVQQFSHELSITNLPSFEGAPNPVASHGALWLFVSAGQTIETVSSPSEHFAVTTPFQCSDPHNLDGNATFAFHVEAVATGEAVNVDAGRREILTVTSGPEAGSYAVTNGGIGDNEGVVFWHNAGIFRLAD